MARSKEENLIEFQRLLHDTGKFSEQSIQAYLDQAREHEDLVSLLEAVKLFEENGIFSEVYAEESLAAAFEHEDLWSVTEVLKILQRADLMSGVDAQKNLKAVLAHEDLWDMPSFLAWFDCFTTAKEKQQCFNQVIEYSKLLFSETLSDLWENIPKAQQTEKNWKSIIQHCRAAQVNQAAGAVHLKRFIRRTLMGIDETTTVLNSAQSTHAKSVHETASESARRLQDAYAQKITDLDASLGRIETWVNEQPGCTVEKRAIQELIHSPYRFIDKASKITNKMLLALVWEAMHDDTILSADVIQAAETRFLEGLVDIQRAYNLTEAFEDAGGADDKACPSGVFHKLLEKLLGAHPLVKIKYITPQGALYKLSPVMLQVAQGHLEKHFSEDLIVSTLKHAIYPRVRERILFEYARGEVEALTNTYDCFELFQASEAYPMFQALIESPQDEAIESLLLTV